MERLPPSLRPTSSGPAPSEETPSAPRPASRATERQGASGQLSGLERRSTPPGGSASSGRRSLLDLPPEMVAGAVSHMDLRTQAIAAQTSRGMNGIVGNLDGARLEDYAERAAYVSDLGKLYEDTPTAPPILGHVAGRPDTIDELPLNQQAGPREAVAARLMSFAQSLGNPGNDNINDTIVLHEIEALFMDLPPEERLPALQVLASRSARINPEQPGEAHLLIAELIEAMPQQAQTGLWQTLARSIPDLPQSEVHVAFNYILDVHAYAEIPPGNDLLDILASSVPRMLPAEQNDARARLAQAAGN